MQVEWGSEQDCFRSTAEELSNFYCFRASPFPTYTQAKDSADPAEGYACCLSCRRDTVVK